MSSKKRKAPDEVVVDTPGEVIYRGFPESDSSSTRDRYYANLYTKEVDLRSLSKQDAEFAAMYGS